MMMTTRFFLLISLVLSWMFLVSVFAIASPPSEDSPSSSEPIVKPSAPRLGWEEAVRTGLDRNPMIQVAQHEFLASNTVTKQIESAYYPQVTGVFANSGGNTRVLANLGISGSLPKPTLYLTTPGLRVDLLITDFGHTAHKVLANEALTASAEKRIFTAKAVVILNVQQAYLTCLKHQKLVDIAKQVITTRELIRTQAEALYRHKLRSKLDLDFASVDVDRAKLNLIKAQKDLKVCFTTLNDAMGIQSSNAYLLEDRIIEVKPSPPIESLFEQALAQRPELLGSQDRLQATEEALKAAKALRFGDIKALGTLAYSWWSREEYEASGAVKNPGKQLGWWGAAVASSFPLFTGGRIQAQIEEADARKSETRADTRSIANDLLLQVAQAYFTQSTAEQQIKIARARVAHAREAMSLAQERYKANLASILDVTTATTNLLNAEGSEAEAHYTYQTSDVALGYAIGNEYRQY
jgi:outer membrane protein